MKSKIIRHRALLIQFLGFLFLGFVWFFWALRPWQGFLNSDDAVPYQHIIEPWRMQDLYFWGTSRMGMLYEVFWKLGATLFLEDPVRQVGSKTITTAFYCGHALLMFLGFPFWLETLKTKWAKIIFLVFFFPLTTPMISMFLLPGQPYGVLFFLMGVLLWFLPRVKNSYMRQLFLGLIIGALWIQHELSGAISLGLTLFLIPSRQYFKTLIPIWIICYFFKMKSELWSEGSHYGINDFYAFMNANWLTIRDGSWWFCIRRLCGHAVTLAILTLIFESRVFLKRPKALFKDIHWLTFFLILGCVLLMHLSHWYVIMGQNPRYYSNLIPLLIWVFLSKAEVISKWNAKKMILILACIVPIYTVQGFDVWINPFRSQTIVMKVSDLFKESVVGLRGEAHIVELNETMRSRFHVLRASGCKGYVDDYWNSHILSVFSNGTLPTSSGGHIRNPEMLDHVLKQSPLCITPRAANLLHYTEHLNCKPTPPGFLICNKP